MAKGRRASKQAREEHISISSTLSITNLPIALIHSCGQSSDDFIPSDLTSQYCCTGDLSFQGMNVGG
jgi:hypothetical protein